MGIWLEITIKELRIRNMWKGLVERANGKLIYIAPGSVFDGCSRVNTFIIINTMIITNIFTYIIMVIVLGDGDQNEANVK